MSYTAPDLMDDVQELLEEHGYTLRDENEDEEAFSEVWRWKLSHAGCLHISEGFESAEFCIKDAVRHALSRIPK